jgi:DNA-binding CsgD family transcriptional regulator
MRGDRRRSGLTSREREVLELVRVGLTNEEIAGRLGISPDTTKYHVSQILAKLGVASREEAGALPDQAPLPWWARALAWSAAAKAAVVAVMLAIVIGLGVMAWAVLATGSGDSAVTLFTASASPIPTPTRGPKPSPTVDFTVAPPPLPTPNPSDLAIRPCRAEDLVGNDVHSTGAGGNEIVFFGIANVSGTACRVHGSPVLQLLDANGDIVGTGPACGSIMSSMNCANTVAILLPGPSPQPSVGPYEGSVSVSWGNPLIFGATPCSDTAASIALDLPDGGGRLVIPDGAIPYCPFPAGVSEFVAAPTPTPTPTATR